MAGGKTVMAAGFEATKTTPWVLKYSPKLFITGFFVTLAYLSFNKAAQPVYRDEMRAMALQLSNEIRDKESANKVVVTENLLDTSSVPSERWFFFDYDQVSHVISQLQGPPSYDLNEKRVQEVANSLTPKGRKIATFCGVACTVAAVAAFVLVPTL
jgi:hypothetical protein